MTNGSTGEKIKEKVMGTKDKVKETVGIGGGEGERKKVLSKKAMTYNLT
jgi:hypothetical protein